MSNERVRNKILIVDDNYASRRLCTVLLKSEYDVSEAKDGGEGLEKAITWQPDLILLDVCMPVLDGHEVLAELIKRGVRTRVVLMSAINISTNSIIEGIKGGACDYLIKPFKPDDLQIRVQRHLIKESTINLLAAEKTSLIDELLRDVQIKEVEICRILENQRIVEAKYSRLMLKNSFKEGIERVAQFAISVGCAIILYKNGFVQNIYHWILTTFIVFVILAFPFKRLKSFSTKILNITTDIEMK